MSALWYLLAAIAAIVAFGWYMISVPGQSHRGALAQLGAEERASRDLLQKHVAAVASAEHTRARPSGSKRPRARSKANSSLSATKFVRKRSPRAPQRFATSRRRLGEAPPALS